MEKEDLRVIVMSGDDATYVQCQGATAVCRERRIEMSGARARYVDGAEDLAADGCVASAAEGEVKVEVAMGVLSAGGAALPGSAELPSELPRLEELPAELPRLEELPAELQTYVLDKSRFPVMAAALRYRIAPFAAEQPSRVVWDAVKYVFQIHGLTPRLSREKFARLVVALCSGLGCSAEALAASMAKSGFDHSRTWAEYARLPETNELKRLGRAIEQQLGEASSEQG